MGIATLNSLDHYRHPSPAVRSSLQHLRRPPGPPRWRRDEIITRNDTRVSAFGANQKLRGRRHRESRPTLIIVDDLENEDLVDSAERRTKLWDWFNKTLLRGPAQPGHQRRCQGFG
jgi:hypothetical protein